MGRYAGQVASVLWRGYLVQRESTDADERQLVHQLEKVAKKVTIEPAERHDAPIHPRPRELVLSTAGIATWVTPPGPAASRQPFTA